MNKHMHEQSIVLVIVTTLHFMYELILLMLKVEASRPWLLLIAFC